MKKLTKCKKLNSKTILVVCLMVVLAVTGVIATLISGDRTDNVFTVGNVKIELTEPNWKPDYDSDEDGEKDTLRNILPTQEIDKDPTLTNKGINDAYVYLMLQIPKAYKVDLHNLRGETTSVSHYPLFDFEANSGWSLIASQIATETNKYESEAYDYYLYGYSQPLKKDESATLFNKVKFANITDEYADLLNEKGIHIKLKGYAIQSDFYETEEIDVTKAWQKFVNQNGWSWPKTPYNGVSTINYVVDDEICYSETNYAGTPIDLYFDSELERAGYRFEWIEEISGDVAYNGMPMPEDDTNLVNHYTEANQENGAFPSVHYEVKNDNGHYYLSVSEVWSIDKNYPDSEFELVIPTHITFTVDRMSIFYHDYGVIWNNGILVKGKTYTLRVEHVASLQEEKQDESGKSDLITKITIPDTVKKIDDDALLSSLALEEIVFPENLTSMPLMSNCPKLKTITIPNGVKSISPETFNGCISLKEIIIPESVEAIGESAFDNCSNLSEVYYKGTEEQWNTITIGANNNILTSAAIHYNSTQS